METIRQIYERLLKRVVVPICEKYTRINPSPSMKRDFENDVRRAMDPYVRNKEIDNYNIRCDDDVNYKEETEEKVVNFLFTVNRGSENEAARNYFKARKV
jgi:hypothetical protein